MNVEHYYSLLWHNTFGIDAYCDTFVDYELTEEAVYVAAALRAEPEVPYIIVGGGSNLLLTQDFHGTVVHPAVHGIFPQDDDTIICGAGEKWDDIVDTAIDLGLYGAENLSLIPGDVGASAVQNIGAYGVEVKDFIEEIEAVEIETGEIRTFKREDCQYGYRQSRFKQDWRNKYLISWVTYRFSRTFEPKLDYGNIRAMLAEQGIEKPTPRQLRNIIIDIRRAKLPDPEELGNAGSFFMNPIVPRAKYEELAAQYEGMPYYAVDEDHVKIPAGWMIDQCGWKGRSLGRAGVHDKQALVLVNRGGATGQEIVDLCHAIQKDVKEKFGIEIKPEVNIV